MSLVIAIASLKGGVGKSTIAINFAVCLHRAGHRTLIIDLDSQGTCQSWSAVASDNEYDGPPVVGMNGKSLRKDIDSVSKGFDVVVIDTPPRLSVEQRAAMLAADIVVMPVTPGPADVWSLRETISLLEEAKEYRPELKAVTVLNRADPRTTISEVTLQTINDAEPPVLNTPLGNRVAFGEAIASGQGVIDYAPDSKASIEIQDFTKAVLAAIEGKKWRKRTH